MKFLHKLKEASISAAPIFGLVLLLHFTVAPMSNSVLIAFIIGALCFLMGEVLFQVGIDNSILTMGESIGSSVVKVKKEWIVLVFGFIFGFLVTISEPDVQVLASQVNQINDNVSRMLLLCAVGIGVGIFTALAMWLSLKGKTIKWVLIGSYAIIFILAIFSGNFLTVAFDSGGVTTGPMSAPFLLALGIGIASIRSENSADSSFGMVAFASIGPIMATMVLGLVFGHDTGFTYDPAQSHTFLQTLFEQMLDVLMGLAPITVTFLVFQFFVIKLPLKKLISIISGVLVVYVGLVLFLTGINYGFWAAGEHIGHALAEGGHHFLLIILGLVIGFILIFTEPSVLVLAKQVEDVTQGRIKGRVLTVTLAIGTAFAVVMAVIKAIYLINMWWFVIPLYAIALALTFFNKEIFIGIAFDSGGVASGPMTATFVLPLVIGITMFTGSDSVAILEYAFGAVALVAVMPLILIQILGIIFNFREKRAKHEVTSDAVFTGDTEIVGLLPTMFDLENDKDFSGLLDDAEDTLSSDGENK